MSPRFTTRRLLAPLLLVPLLLPASGCWHHDHSSSSSSPAPAAQPLTGHIYTTDAAGAPVEDGLFTQACDVWLAAGPLADADDPGLPAGDYYVQVTDATGAVRLSKEGPLNGVLTVGGEGPEPAGTFGAYEGELEVIEPGADAGLRLRLCPLEAPSADGLYTVWLTRRADYAPDEGVFGFLPERSLVHGFAVSGGVSDVAELVLRRFCDRDADGDPQGESFLDGVRFMVSISSIDDGMPFEVRTGETTPGEARLVAVPVPASFSVCELVPGTGAPGTWWYGTLPGFGASAGAPGAACYAGQLIGGEQLTLLFGAACVRTATDGRRWDFLVSQQGQALLASHDPAWRALLDGAGLVAADGSAWGVPDGPFHLAYGSLVSWLTDTGAGNEAHRLSREVAAALVAAEYAGLDAEAARVLRPAFAACLGQPTATSAELVARAQALIVQDGFTPAGDPAAPPQKCLRDALASLNTNAAPILEGHCCDAVYP